MPGVGAGGTVPSNAAATQRRDSTIASADGDTARAAGERDETAHPKPSIHKADHCASLQDCMEWFLSGQGRGRMPSAPRATREHRRAVGNRTSVGDAKIWYLTFSQIGSQAGSACPARVLLPSHCTRIIRRDGGLVYNPVTLVTNHRGRT